MHFVPLLCARVHYRVIEAPVGPSRGGGGAIVPVRAMGGHIKVLQSLSSLSRWDVDC